MVRQSQFAFALVLVGVIVALGVLTVPATQAATKITWTGDISTNWGDKGNWNPQTVPSSPQHDVVIPTVLSKRYPGLNADRTISNLTVNAGAKLALNGRNLTVQSILNNRGTIELQCGEKFAVGSQTGSGTWKVLGKPTETTLCNFTPGHLYHTFVIELSRPTGIVTLQKTLNSTFKVTVSRGSLSLNGQDVVSPVFQNDHRVFLIGSEAVTADLRGNGGWFVRGLKNGKADTITLGSRAFRHLEISPFEKDETFVWPAGATIEGRLSVWGGTLLTDSSVPLLVDGDLWLNDGTFHTKGSVQVTKQIVIQDGTYIMSYYGQHTFGSMQLMDGAFLGGGSAGTLVIGGKVTMSSGTIVLPSKVILAGDLLKTAGKIEPRVSTVELKGADQLITGNWYFYNLSKIEPSGGLLRFGKDALVSVSGTLTMEGGGPARQLTLRPSTSGQKWTLIPSGGRAIRYLHVTGSKNGNVLQLRCQNGCTDGGENTNWLFR